MISFREGNVNRFAVSRARTFHFGICSEKWCQVCEFRSWENSLCFPSDFASTVINAMMNILLVLVGTLVLRTMGSPRQSGIWATSNSCCQIKPTKNDFAQDGCVEAPDDSPVCKTNFDPKVSKLRMWLMTSVKISCFRTQF
jgi:hypothetical protein